MKAASDGAAAQGAGSGEGGAARRSGSNMQPKNTARLPPLLLKCHRTSLHSHLSHAPDILPHTHTHTASQLLHHALVSSGNYLQLNFVSRRIVCVTWPFFSHFLKIILKYRKSVTFSRSGGRGTPYKRRNIYVGNFCFQLLSRKKSPPFTWLTTRVFTNCKLKHKAV